MKVHYMQPCVQIKTSKKVVAAYRKVMAERFQSSVNDTILDRSIREANLEERKCGCLAFLNFEHGLPISYYAKGLQLLCEIDQDVSSDLGRKVFAEWVNGACARVYSGRLSDERK